MSDAGAFEVSGAGILLVSEVSEAVFSPLALLPSEGREGVWEDALGGGGTLMTHNQRLNLEEILMRMQKPGRYVGGEQGAVLKDAGRVAMRVAMCFPDLYEVAMSHLGIKILR